MSITLDYYMQIPPGGKIHQQ